MTHKRTVTVSRPVQEHLGRELRSVYRLTEDMPAFLGDPTLPAAFRETLRRVEECESERIHDRAFTAVEAALFGKHTPL